MLRRFEVPTQGFGRIFGDLNAAGIHGPETELGGRVAFFGELVGSFTARIAIRGGGGVQSGVEDESAPPIEPRGGEDDGDDAEAHHQGANLAFCGAVQFHEEGGK